MDLLGVRYSKDHPRFADQLEVIKYLYVVELATSQSDSCVVLEWKGVVQVLNIVGLRTLSGARTCGRKRLPSPWTT